MTKWLQQLKKSRKLLIALAVAGAIAVPVGVSYAQSGETKPPVAQQQVVTEEDPVVEEPVVTEQEPVVVVNEETPSEQTPTPDPVEGAVAVDLAQAQVIAEAEHTGSTVVVTKTVTNVLEGKTVFTFKFEDGWRVSVRAEDGLVVKVVDPSDKSHGCQNKYKKNADATAAANWNRRGDSERKDRNNNDDNDRRGERHNSERNSGNRHNR